MENKPHKLFISHSSKDAEYMKAFVDLLVAIGVHKNQITCTSVPQCNIPVGDRKSTRLNSSHTDSSRMPSSA